MSMPVGPCQYCKNREVGCHAKCEAYIKFRKELDDYNEQVRRQKQMDRWAIPEKPKRKRKEK